MRNALSIIGCISFGSLAACGGISDSLDAPSLDAGEVDDSGLVSDRDGAVKQDGSAIDVIDPIAMGEAWTYDVTVAGEFSECDDGSFAANVSQTESLDGKNAFLISSFCPGIQSVWYASDGDTVYAYDGQDWLLALGAPVVDGHTWTKTLETFVWKDVGQVTVPAGTFSNCFEADVQEEAQYYAVTFCRGAGPVKWHYRDASGSNGDDAVLHSKNF
jgi:hypothetical protein